MQNILICLTVLRPNRSLIAFSVIVSRKQTTPYRNGSATFASRACLFTNRRWPNEIVKHWSIKSTISETPESRTYSISGKLFSRPPTDLYIWCNNLQQHLKPHPPRQTSTVITSNEKKGTRNWGGEEPRCCDCCSHSKLGILCVCMGVNLSELSNRGTYRMWCTYLSPFVQHARP